MAYRRIAPYTMLPFDALSQAQDAVDDVDARKIPGAIVEMGCWKGGCGAVMAWRSKRNGSDRPIWLFDSFEGIPELAEQDREWAEHSRLKMREKGQTGLKPAGYYLASVSDVEAALVAVGATAKARIVKGWFQDSLPPAKSEIGSIAVLRLDGDLYESTKFCLEELYGQVAVGGWIIIDDFHLEGCRKAIFEFMGQRGLAPFIVNAPGDGRAWFRKA